VAAVVLQRYSHAYSSVLGEKRYGTSAWDSEGTAVKFIAKKVLTFLRDMPSDSERAKVLKECLASQAHWLPKPSPEGGGGEEK
jgi:hypothetical protein